MKFHIVRSGETLEKIMFMYEVTEDEIKEVNKHIKNFRNLIPGSKLKIPTITENIDEEIMEMEPFVEDYYPKNDYEEEQEVMLEPEEPLVEVESPLKDENEVKEEIKEVQIDINKETRESLSKEKEKPEKASPKHKLNYYPYYYYNPYYGRYFVYYLPVYS